MRQAVEKAMLSGRDILTSLWRFFCSPRLTVGLLITMVLVVAIGAIVPQTPVGLAVGSSEYGRWFASMTARYLRWADVFEDLGLFRISDSIWFKIPLGLLILNLAVCAVEQCEAALSWPDLRTEEFDTVFRRASQARRLVIPGRLKPVVSNLTTLLQKHHYQVGVREAGERSHLVGQRFSGSRWGGFLVHVGLIITTLGLAMGRSLAWREEDISLSAGQAYQIQHAPSVSMRLDDFQADLYPDGSPRSYWAQVTLLEQETEVTTGVVAPNAPLVYRWMAIFQRSHGPLITVEALDGQGRSISVQALAPGGTPQEQAILHLSNNKNEGYVAVPEQNLILRLVFHSQQSSGTAERPTLLVQAYRDGMSQLVFSQTLFDSASLQIEGSSYSVQWGHYPVLAVIRDLGFPLTMLGAIILLAAATMTLYLPPRCLWTAISEKGGVVEMRLVALGGVVPRDLDILTKEVRQGL